MKAANFYTCIVPNLEGRMKNLWNNTQTERDIKYQQRYLQRNSNVGNKSHFNSSKSIGTRTRLKISSKFKHL